MHRLTRTEATETGQRRMHNRNVTKIQRHQVTVQQPWIDTALLYRPALLAVSSRIHLSTSSVSQTAIQHSDSIVPWQRSHYVFPTYCCPRWLDYCNSHTNECRRTNTITDMAWRCVWLNLSTDSCVYHNNMCSTFSLLARQERASLSGWIVIIIKISPIRDWRSTPTYCQLQSHVTQKLRPKSKIRSR